MGNTVGVAQSWAKVRSWDGGLRARGSQGLGEGLSEALGAQR